MKTRLYFIGLIVLFCGLSGLQNSVFGQGKETRNVSSFTGIHLMIHGDVYFTQGSPQELILESDKDDLEKVETEVDGNNLEIKLKDSYRNFKGKVIVHIKAPVIEEFLISGSGKFIAESAIITDELKIHISGSGDIQIGKLACGNLEGEISGSGNIEIAGNANNAEFNISGSGRLTTYDLVVLEETISVSGAGNCNINVKEKLNANVSGSGDISYKGRPVINSKSSGSGHIRHQE